MNVFIYGNAQIDEKIQIFLILFFSLTSISDNLTLGVSYLLEYQQLHLASSLSGSRARDQELLL